MSEDREEGFLDFRKHTKNKLKILEYYYPQWDKIVGKYGKLHYIIDLTSGTGYIIINDKKVKGSALKACELLRNQKNLELIFVERELNNYNVLCESIKPYEVSFPGKIRVFNADCYNIIDDILKIIKGNIALFIMDPYGPVDWKLIEKIGNRAWTPKPYSWGTEIFVFFNAPYIYRFGSSLYNYDYETLKNKKDKDDSETRALNKIKEINKIFGNVTWHEIFYKFKGKLSNIYDHLLGLYVSQLKQFFRFVTPLKVTDSRNTLKYYFIFTSNHYPAFNMVNNKMKKIKIQNTLLKFGIQYDKFNDIKSNILKNIIGKVSNIEKSLILRIINYRDIMETDYYDQNLKAFCKEKKVNFFRLVNHLVTKRILLESFEEINNKKIKKFKINEKLKEKPKTLMDFMPHS
ncbi:MAG: three-Cys-motif partner protein TcmP [Candidatus Helarchaeota archaeon]